MLTKFWLENLKRSGHLEDLDVGGMIFEMILRDTGWEVGIGTRGRLL
jgi:hypothetical protein